MINGYYLLIHVTKIIMSLYNLINGINPSVFVFLPMLGRHPEEYPRFRDCFLGNDENSIIIFTRVGGGNRNCGYGETELYKDPNFMTTYDDSFDTTYGSYVFRVPDKWKDDFEAIKNGGLSKASIEYLKYLIDFWKTNEMLVEKLKEILKTKEQEQNHEEGGPGNA